ncbi:putative membrane protein [Natranaerovirga hydrolytica]|uniref:Putative membrane protein n=1 Tax=Natranaerovirga hydrolytica TaxID=680378 RepID=A0A4R1MZ95_9FIRM|nr:DUF5668 domain-containing protein [Natranaerovirga hydrolytica]TCK98495.1 putative membrane protein [Natranaerovirga hydrolytica]
MLGNKIIGIILVFLGLGFFLQQANVIEFRELISVYWPIILIVVGVIQLLRKQVSIIGGAIMVIIGGIILGNRLEVLPNNLSHYLWPTILILVGIWFLASNFGENDKNVNTEDQISSMTIFGGIETKNASKNFKGGHITAVFGGGEIDLTQAQASEEGVTLELTTIFGGIDIRVPKDWKVVVTGVPIFGGWEDRTRPEGDETSFKTVNIRCFAMFGGIEISN